MNLLIFRTIGLIIVSVIAVGMYLIHMKKKTKFIKRKPQSKEEKIKYQKWEKMIHILGAAGIFALVIFITIPCCMDIPYLITGDLIEVSGTVTQGAMAGADSAGERRIHIRDSRTDEDHSLKFWGFGVDINEKITARYLPHTEYGYLVKE